MGNINTRPFVPIGSYTSKSAANNACVTLNREHPDQHWERCPHPKLSAAYSIIRKS